MGRGASLLSTKYHLCYFGNMEPQVEFIGWQIKPKEEVSVAEELENDSLVTIHITQVALGDAASNDRHTVFITNETGKFAIGTLDREKPHFSVDFMAAESDLIFSHTGETLLTAPLLGPSHIRDNKADALLGTSTEAPHGVDVGRVDLAQSVRHRRSVYRALLGIIAMFKIMPWLCDALHRCP